MAQTFLGECYATGEGVPKDSVEAVKWYRKAAEQGNAVGQMQIGRLYFTGEGVAKDEVEAYKWWLLAAAQDYKFAKEGIAISEKRLTREQIAEGQKLARNFKPRLALKTGESALPDQTTDLPPTASGTGFLITNQHVIAGANQVRLLTSSGLISAKVVKVVKVVKVDARSNDLALFKADGKFVAIPITTSRSVKLGSSVATVGFPNIGLQGFLR